MSFGVEAGKHIFVVDNWWTMRHAVRSNFESDFCSILAASATVAPLSSLFSKHKKIDSAMAVSIPFPVDKLTYVGLSPSRRHFFIKAMTVAFSIS